MSDEQRAALRIALAFASAFTLAEAWDLQLSFVAPLAAGVMASGPAVPAVTLLALPVVAWTMVLAAGFALQLLSGMPVVLCLLLLPIFRLGFQLSAGQRTSNLGLMLLAVFAILPQVLITAPELSTDCARWFFGNLTIASGCVFAVQFLLPDQAMRPAPVPNRPQLPALGAAFALLLAGVLVAILKPPAMGATLIGVIIALRADGRSTQGIIRARFLAALLGGAAALLVWQIIWLAPSLPVLATSTLLLAWLLARHIAADGPNRDIAVKSLNAMGILLGQGFSVFYEDTDERLWTRFVGVVIGLAYAAGAIAIGRAMSARRVPARPLVANMP